MGVAQATRICALVHNLAQATTAELSCTLPQRLSCPRSKPANPGGHLRRAAAQWCRRFPLWRKGLGQGQALCRFRRHGLTYGPTPAKSPNRRWPFILLCSPAPRSGLQKLRIGAQDRCNAPNALNRLTILHLQDICPTTQDRCPIFPEANSAVNSITSRAAGVRNVWTLFGPCSLHWSPSLAPAAMRVPGSTSRGWPRPLRHGCHATLGTESDQERIHGANSGKFHANASYLAPRLTRIRRHNNSRKFQLIPIPKDHPLATQRIVAYSLGC